MLLFRSEEHLGRWLDSREAERGGVMTLEQTWRLAKGWYSGRLLSTWRARSVEEAQAVIDGAGLAGNFWQLVPDTV